MAEVWQSFLLSPASYRSSYLLRTLLELLLAGGLLLLLLFRGLPDIFHQSDSLPCTVASSLYTCTGAPLTFYRPVLLLALLLLLLHLLANLYNIYWLLLPQICPLLSLLPPCPASWTSTPDFHLLLRLLTTTSGPGVALRALLLLHQVLLPSCS